MGRGHGSRFLRRLAAELIADGAPLVAIDPDADNARAIAAYRKAGFSGETMIQTPDGPILLMLFGG